MSERGRLEVEVSGNASGFRNVLNTVKQHTKQFSSEVQADVNKSWSGIGKGFVGGIAGALSFESIKGLIQGAFQRAGELKDLSEQFDLSTDSIQIWEKALNKAGVSTSLFFRALETLRSKRAEAREDPKKMEAFGNIGLSGQARSAAVNDEQLLRMILGSGASRVQLNELLGRGGAKLRAAAGELGTNAPLSSEDIERMDKAGKAIESTGGFLKRIAGSRIAEITSLFSKDTWKNGEVGSRLLGVFSGIRYQNQGERNRKAEREKLERADAEKDALDAEQAANDEQMAAQAAKDLADQSKASAIEERLKDAQRKNMPTSAQRASREKELKDLDGRIKYYEDAKGLLSPADQEKLTGLKIQREGLLGELREKPIQLGADSLAKSGLFSASALNFSMESGTQRQQLEVLRQIARNTAGGNNPFKW